MTLDRLSVAGDMFGPGRNQIIDRKVGTCSVSITYRFELGAPVTPDAVVSAMVKAAAEAIEGYEGTQGRLRGGGWFDVDVAEYDPPDPVEDQFGFRPAINAAFGLNKFGDFRAQETDVLRLVVGVLAQIPGDALLHYLHEEVWLLRRGGKLTIDQSLWTPQQLSLLSQPYECGSIPFG